MSNVLGILAVVLALPFFAYGVVGLMRALGVDRFLSGTLGVKLTDDPVISLGYLAIGLGVYFALKLAAGKS